MCVRVGTDGEKRHHAEAQRGSGPASAPEDARAGRPEAERPSGLGSGSDKVQHIFVKKKF